MREKIIMEVPPDFDWRIYLELNEDITKYPHYTTQSGAISHWKLYGSKEGRPYKKNQVRRISSESTPIPTPEPEIIVETKNNVVEKLNNSKKLLTIVIPNKMGQTPHLTINSLYKQTFTNFDIIVVNDNDGNANAARNRGFFHVETPYVLFSDNDIEWEPDAIESMLVCLEENKNVSFAYGHWELKNKIKSNKEWNVDDLYKSNYISMMSVVRTAHHPGFDENIKRFQDWDVWLTMAKENRIGKYIGKKIFTTPFRADGITQNSRDSIELEKIVRNKHFLNDIQTLTPDVVEKYYSIVIPTMWLSDKLEKMLKIYENSVYVKEVILIDNDPTKKIDLSEFSKVRYYTKGKNIYVNPSWNWGYSLSNYELILANDDIYISNFNVMMDIISKSLDDYDIIGMDFSNKNLEIKPLYSDVFPEKSFGCFMYIKNYIYIPDDIKIWCGDAILFNNNKRRAFLSNPNFVTNPSTTVNSDSNYRNVIGKKDLEIYSKMKNNEIKENIKDKTISVNMATYPAREGFFLKCLENLLNIELIDVIRIYLNEYLEIPNHFPKNDKIIYLTSDVNLKDSGKFYWADNYKNEYYFTIDDDILYSDEYFINHLKTIKKYKNKILVTSHGKVMSKNATNFSDYIESYHFGKKLVVDKWVNNCGTGVLVFDNSRITIPKDLFKYHGMTDLWISQYCQLNKIPILCRNHSNTELKYMLTDDKTLFDMRNDFKNEHKEILCSIDEWNLYKSSNLKIGAIYNTFYGLELIEKSINSIKNVVDYIVLVHQKIGFNGNKENDNNVKIINYLLENKLIDDILYYEPNIKDKSEKLNVYIHNEILNKRNIGLDYCIKNNCDYIIPLDTDELYNSIELLDEIEYMNSNNIDTLYCPIYSYYYDEYHYFEDTYYVPSVFKVDDRKFKKIESNILADPVRRMDERNYRISKIHMHHLTFLKDSYTSKINSKVGTLTSKIVKEGSVKILDHLKNWKEGDDALIFSNNSDGEVILKTIKLQKTN